jgi:hypothetical protein
VLSENVNLGLAQRDSPMFARLVTKPLSWGGQSDSETDTERILTSGQPVSLSARG